MDTVRLRRLWADHEALRRLAHLHPKIEIEGAFGNPPERYRLRLLVKSLRERGDELETATEHRLEVTLPKGYPRDAPLCRMLTPVFHPNIAPHAVCVGDNWTAGEPIDLLIQRVGEILAYQSYNIKSPLNGRAAQWVDEHRELVPIDPDEFFVDLSDAPGQEPEPGSASCSNCGAHEGPFTACPSGHIACQDCAVDCPTCERPVCLTCGDSACPVCTVPTILCKNCGDPATGLLCASEHLLCASCGITCPTCEAIQCLACGTYPCPSCPPSGAVR